MLCSMFLCQLKGVLLSEDVHEYIGGSTEVFLSGGGFHCEEFQELD